MATTVSESIGDELGASEEGAAGAEAEGGGEGGGEGEHDVGW